MNCVVAGHHGTVMQHCPVHDNVKHLIGGVKVFHASILQVCTQLLVALSGASAYYACRQLKVHDVFLSTLTQTINSLTVVCENRTTTHAL